jgi:diguanylate cyclase (GGDEF)-like protein
MGLARPMFMDLAEREWSRARRYGSGVAVLLVDVDRPARLAESAGPAAADSMLKALIELSGPGLRPADMITRFGSQRMAVFLAPADPTGALDVAERIRERAERLELSKPRSTVFQSAPAPALAKVTVSIGVAHMRPAHLNLQAMLDDADDALVAAREAGGNCVRAAPVDAGRLRGSNRWTGDDRRAWPKQGGSA